MRNDRALGDGKSDNNKNPTTRRTRTTFVAIGDAVIGCELKQYANEGCNSCANLAGLVLSFIHTELYSPKIGSKKIKRT